MTRTTQPTTKAERDEWRINGWGAHGFPERLLDDADQREELMQILSYEGEMHANAATLYKEQLDALRQRVAVANHEIVRLRAALNQIAWPSSYGLNWEQMTKDGLRHIAVDALAIMRPSEPALSASPPKTPDPKAKRVVFEFDARSLMTVEEIKEKYGIDFHEIPVRDPKTGEHGFVYIPVARHEDDPHANR